MTRLLMCTLMLWAPEVLAGRGKIIEFKAIPKSIKSISEQLPKEKKDLSRRSAMSLLLDDMLRDKPEVTDPAFYDTLVAALLNDVLDRVSEPSEVFTTETGAEKFNPRADFILKEQVKLRPARVTSGFSRTFTKKAQGKNIDRGYRNQPLNITFATAANDDEFTKWIDTQGWGVTIHAARVDAPTGVARIACTFISPGTAEAPGGRFERPSWVAFYKQPKPGVGAFVLLGIEAETSTDWREQPINAIVPKAEPNDLSRKLSLDVWMEQVRAIPVRPKLAGQEATLFNLEFETADKLDLPQASWLERYRDSDSPQVRAAAELKLAALGGAWSPDNVWAILRGIKHPVVKARLEEQLKKAPEGWKPAGPGAPAAADGSDGGKSVDAGK